MRSSLVLVLALLVVAPPARASEAASSTEAPPPELTPWTRLGSNLEESFVGPKLLLHLAAVGATWLLVERNVDARIETYFLDHPSYSAWALPAVIGNSISPLVAVGALYGLGKLRADDETLAASFAVLQASVLTLTYVSLLKGLTGRVPPGPGTPAEVREASRNFRFGFLRGGIFWGWPSGHTAAAMAIASTLASFYPDSSWTKVLGYSWVAYTVFSVSAFGPGRMHWFSEAVAASFMAYAIGSSVGSGYRQALDGVGRESTAPAWAVVPSVAADRTTLTLLRRF